MPSHRKWDSADCYGTKFATLCTDLVRLGEGGRSGSVCDHPARGRYDMSIRPSARPSPSLGKRFRPRSPEERTTEEEPCFVTYNLPTALILLFAVGNRSVWRIFRMQAQNVCFVNQVWAQTYLTIMTMVLSLNRVLIFDFLSQVFSAI